MSQMPPESVDDGPPPAAPPGPIVQSAAIGFRVVYIVTLCLAVIWALSNFKIIPPDKQAVVMRYGRVVRTQKSGLLPALPRPFEDVRLLAGPDRRLSRKVGSLATVAGLVDVTTDPGAVPPPATAAPYLTGEGPGTSNVVLLDATLTYRIVEPVAYVLSQDHVEAAMDRMFRATAVQVVAGQKLNDFMAVEPSAGGNADAVVDARRAAARNRLLNGINARLKALETQGAGLGVVIERIDITPTLPPRARVAYEAVATATQKAEENIAAANNAAELRSQGADQEAERLVSAAQAVAQERITQASVDTRSISAIERSAGAVRTGLEQKAYRDNISSVLAKAGQVIAVDPNSSPRMVISGPNPAARGK